MLLTGFVSRSAVNAYTFASGNASYAAISGTTLFSGAWDDGSSSLITIPFVFNYNGISYTTLSVNCNGFITMGAVSTNVYCGLQTSTFNSIAGYGTDLFNGSATSNIQYTSSGVAPNRKFIVQWSDAKHYGTTGDLYNFQIVLNETSNTVQVIWGAITSVTTMGANSCLDASTESGSVGLLGLSTADFNIRSVTNGTNTWATSVNGAALSSVCNMSPTNIPASGLVYTWTPPAPVAMTFTSCTSMMLNNGEANGQGATLNKIIQVQVVTSGSLSPLSITNLQLSTTGCSNPLGDITNAKVYFTGSFGTFSSLTQFGATVISPNGTFSMTGNATLAEGTNYFWVTYDLNTNATIGNLLKACCNQLTGSGSIGVRTPTVTCPVGSHSIIAPIGFWTPVTTNAPGNSGGLMLLLSDGTVMAKSSAGGASVGNLWNKLTPDATGSYVNGTWTTLAPMIDTRLYFSSQVLKDGRVYVAGGEYGTGLQKAETYNPLTNVWTAAPSQPPTINISDANSEILSDGRVLQALVTGSLTSTVIYNPVTNTYTAGPSTLGIHNESAWIKLADNSILFVDRLATTSERYIPATNTWVSDATVPVALYDPYGDETGGALLLPDGRAFFIGSIGHTAYYTPSGTSSPGTWAAGPDIPGAQGVPDGAAAMMVNGKILMVVSPIPTSADHFPPPTAFYEFDYLTNTYTLIATPFGGTSTSMSCYITNFLDLPDGTVMYSTQGSPQYFVYTPATAALTAGKPTIATVLQTGCSTFSITGTKFNGISQGATYGDDWQMNTNYPVIRLTNGNNVYYCRTFNWNTTGVQRGILADTVQFSLPAGLPVATYSLVVTANGIASNPISFTPTPYLTSSLSATACSGTAFAYTPTSAPAGASFTWTRAAVAGISNAAVTVPQSTNPNELLVNTTASPVSVVYSFTITSNGCSNTQSVTVVVNPAPTVGTTVTLSSVCAGTSTSITGTGADTYTWNPGALSGTSVTLTPASTTTYTLTGTTTATGCTNTSTRLITVNPLPAVGTTVTLSTLCAGTSTTITGTNANTYTWNPGALSGTSVTVTPAATTTYTVTGTTTSTGCTNTSTRLITVNPLPTVGTTVTLSTLCAGTSTTITGTNANTYTWNPGALSGTSVTVTPASTTTYTVTGTTTVTGCTNTSTQLITVNPLPTVGTTVTLSSVCAGTSTTITGTNANTYTWNPGALSGTSVTVTPAATTTYTVTGTTTATGCTNTSTRLITVNPLPTVGTTVTLSSVCAGTSTTITGTNANTYTWNPGALSGTSVTVTPAATTTYTVIGTNTATGCTNSSTRLITVNPLPAVGTTVTSATICAGTSTTMTGTNANTYTWNPGAFSGTSITVTPAVTTTYTVTGTTTATGCTNTSTRLITVTNCSSTLNLKVLIQGFYNGSGLMNAVLINQGVSANTSITDSVTVQLRNTTSPYAVVASVKPLLNLNGTTVCTFTPSVSGSYYIAVRHRNGIQTWSASPVLFSTSPVNYDFTTAANKAYGNNMMQLAAGIWALYSGDINQDENTDLLDLSMLETDISNFSFGYKTTDLNGDGNVDLLDSPVLEDNINNFIFSNHP